MISFDNVSLQRGTKVLLQNSSVQLHRGQRVGLTGANGCGKTSLLMLITGALQVDDGELNIQPGLQLATVEQETRASDQAALEFVIDGDQQLRDVEKSLANANDDELAHLHQRMEELDGYTASARAAKLLNGLGFAEEQLQQPLQEFSGGWRVRLNLARALMCPADMLLLDEPTNHLDLEAVVWLEQWLANFDGLLLLISHDREFLDAVTTHIVSIEACDLVRYRGNYSAYEKQRAARLAQQQSMHEKQQREISHMQSYVDRFRAKATKAKQAQSRLKALARMEQIAPAHVDSEFHFAFKAAPRASDPLLKIVAADIGYAGEAILRGIDLQVRPGDRIGLLGPNGAGKSTLIKMLAGSLPLMAGEFSPAKGLKLGYFAQHQLEQLDPQGSPLLHLQRLDKSVTEQQARNFFGGFGFHGDRVLEEVEPFSGGEKSRLVLALLVWQEPNLLLLDEPTNHLDLEMRHALTVALQSFDGALLVVSHDRHLLRTCADDLYLVFDGKVEEYQGDLDDYRQFLGQSSQTEKSAKKSGQSRKEARQNAAAQRKKLQPIKRQLKKVEAQLEELRQQQAANDELLTNNDLYSEESKAELEPLLVRRAEISTLIEDSELEWLRLGEQLEHATAGGEA